MIIQLLNIILCQASLRKTKIYILLLAHMIYAILEVSGKQLWIQPGRFYDLNKIDVKPGQYIKLEKILMFKNYGEIKFGTPCVPNLYVKGKVLRHMKGSKITVFKMKSKKNIRIKNGHRQELSRVLIESVNIK